MPIAGYIHDALSSSSMIRRMFEEGLQLKKQYGNDKVFDFSLGNPDIEPPQAFHDLFVKLAQEDEKGSHGYMPNSGYSFVRDALAKKVNKEHNVKVDGSHIVMACGAAGGMNAVLKAICNQGDEVIVSRPFFMEYRAYASNHGAKLVEVESKENFSLDINAIGEALNERTAAVIINSPNNPTGKVYPAQDLISLAALLKGHGQKRGRLPYLVSDEPYREIVYGYDVPPVLCCYSESIIVYSYSKSLSLPGERIGYIAVSPEISGKEELINALVYTTRILGYVNAPALMQRIVGSLTEVKIDVSVYARRRDVFMKVLNEAGIEYADPQGAFYLFCKAPIKGGIRDDKAFTEHLKKYLILGVPGSAFGRSGWMRFAYCTDENIIRNSGSAFKEAVKNW